jgi:hypothetical protein
VIVMPSAKAKGHFDASSPRVKKADADITRLLGHSLEFYFDAALVPTWADGFEYLSIAAIETAADTLARLRSQQPEIFAWSAPRLKRIEWDYSATNEHTKHSFDPKTGILRIVLTPRSENQSSEDAIRFSLGRAYAQNADGRFAGGDPASFSGDERARYVDYLVGFAYGREKERHPPTKEEEATDPVQARVILLVLRAWTVYQGDAPQEQKLRKFLVEQAAHVASMRRSNWERLARLSPDADERRMESAYVAWLNASFDALTERERVAIFEEAAFADRDERERPFPGFDYSALWLRTLPRWLAAGHPAERQGQAEWDRQHLFDLVLDPVRMDKDDVIGCVSQKNVTYEAAVKDSNVRDRMFAAAFDARDPAALKLVMANMLGLPKPDLALVFWRAAMRDDASFVAVSRIVAGYAGRCSHGDAIFDVLPGLWKENATPVRRGVLLYVARHFGSKRDDFPRWFGPLTQKEWEAYLDAEPDALREIHFQWPLLGKGYSHAAPVLARLDRWLTEDPARHQSILAETMDTLARDLCAEGNTSDLGKLHDWLGARANAHPSEVRALQTALDRTTPGGCPKNQVQH